MIYDAIMLSMRMHHVREGERTDHEELTAKPNVQRWGWQVRIRLDKPSAQRVLTRYRSTY